jgi:hypothetical protein
MARVASRFSNTRIIQIGAHQKISGAQTKSPIGPLYLRGDYTMLDWNTFESECLDIQRRSQALNPNDRWLWKTLVDPV